MAKRTIAIGDIHGHARALESIINLISPEQNDLLVFLGDYVNRGPNSKGVLDLIIDLQRRCQVVALKGNHELMMLDALQDPNLVGIWLDETTGGLATLQSYGSNKDLSVIPVEHRDFLERLQPFYETDTHFFIHANYLPMNQLNQQPPDVAFWTSIDESYPAKHHSGKIAVVGHTVQRDRRIIVDDYLICIDTGCGFGGCLTAYDLNRDDGWQVTEDGQPI